MNEGDQRLIRASLEVARKAREHGNHPFGALLVDAQGQILLTAENTVVTEKDCTGHAETNLVRQATRTYDHDFLATCSLYSSTEPCAMCAGAIFWSNIRRVVFGLSEESLITLAGGINEGTLYLPCRELFARGQKPITVVGPVLEEEAKKVHEGFWS
ncbi:MAG: nucleoside deaminase [Anaerolineales bacterium]|nr:nucleoside deaminase [Anaerolineales bacterium]